MQNTTLLAHREYCYLLFSVRLYRFPGFVYITCSSGMALFTVHITTAFGDTPLPLIPSSAVQSMFPHH